MELNTSHYYLYIKNISQLRECYRYGITCNRRVLIYNSISSQYRFNVLVDIKDIIIEKIDEGIYLLKSYIPPENVIEAIDTKSGKTISRIIAENKKPSALYHGTNIYNIENILKTGVIKKSYNFSGHYVFGHGKLLKSQSHVYFGDCGGVIEINTSNYDVVELMPYEYGITEDVVIDDIESISFFIKNDLICIWNKEDVINKHNNMKINDNSICHIYRFQRDLSNQQIYEVFNDFVLR